ncbi:hypothetical protein EDD15DRAFT_2157546 [Pisolithus albus]|nr:hypothetical protein EDD15DRAFT_2157291 [Pisolithus albus]KAI6003083.1 hypothetical protein EDD15DRAFT_2157546 [Pisolithus albus]
MPQFIPRSHRSWRASTALRIPCPHMGCSRWFKSVPGLKHHRSSAHNYSFDPTASANNPHDYPVPTKPAPGIVRDYHNELTGKLAPWHRRYLCSHYFLGDICDTNGLEIDPNTPLPPISEKDPNDWAPYCNQAQFETAEFLFKNAEMSAGNIDRLCDLWGSSLRTEEGGYAPPFADHKHLYNTIDSTPLGDVPWDSFKLKYSGDRPMNSIPPWMDQTYEFWFRPARSLIANILANTEFNGEFDYVPYRDFSEDDEKRRYQNFMSGDWAWMQADKIAEDGSTHSGTFVPIILGSDKTTVSVATGQNDYWPVYISIGNIHNNIRRAHRDGVELLAFLAIPKVAKKYVDDPVFRRFKKQLFHAAMSRILASLKPGMTIPQVMKCPDRHFRRIIFGLGPYIADYPEQVLLSGIVQNWCGRCIAFPTDLDGGGAPRTSELTRALVEELPLGVLWDEWGIDGNVIPFTEDFPRADIRQLLAPDILHQLVKGTFKDHLVEWVGKYLELEYGKAGAKERLADIDRRIAAAPPFPGLRRFPDGRGFSQWTGDDSKALMKVYLPAIEGHVPDGVIRTFRAFLEVCYIVRHNVITDDTLVELKDALNRFHQYRTVFKDIGVRPEGFSLPRQHSLVHYEALIRLFGAPNGLCTSITESKHITAVKKPWRRSNKHNALGQILQTNQRISQLAAARADFEARGMLPTAVTVFVGGRENGAIQCEDGGNSSLDEDGNAGIVDERPGLAHSDVKLARSRNRARNALALAIELGIPSLPKLIAYFISDQLQPDRVTPIVPCVVAPFTGRLKVFHSATATFVAPSDPSGIGSMRREYIRAMPSWHQGPARYDCIFVSTDDTREGMLSMDVAQVHCFFSLVHTNGRMFQCALVRWFDRIADKPGELTGMWMVAPSFLEDGSPHHAVIHIDSIVRSAHLLPIFGSEYVSPYVNCHNSLEVFRGFYVNRFADHHAFELAS